MLAQVSDEGGVWAAECRLRNFAGVPMTSRMTVIRLGRDRLFLHSPIRLTPELKAALDALGACRWIVAPNRYHHMFVGDYRPAYPEARLVAAPGLAEKRRDLTFDHVLGRAPEPDWGGAIAHEVIGGSPTMGEVAFHHAPSGTLLLTDFALNVRGSSPWGLRFWAWLNGTYGKLAPARIVRFTYRDRAAVRASVERILAWDIRRIVPCHGDIVEQDARAALLRATSWLR